MVNGNQLLNNAHDNTINRNPNASTHDREMIFDRGLIVTMAALKLCSLYMWSDDRGSVVVGRDITRSGANPALVPNLSQLSAECCSSQQIRPQSIGSVVAVATAITTNTNTTTTAATQFPTRKKRHNTRTKAYHPK